MRNEVNLKSVRREPSTCSLLMFRSDPSHSSPKLLRNCVSGYGPADDAAASQPKHLNSGSTTKYPPRKDICRLEVKCGALSHRGASSRASSVAFPTLGFSVKFVSTF